MPFEFVERPQDVSILWASTLRISTQSRKSAYIPQVGDAVLLHALTPTGEVEVHAKITNRHPDGRIEVKITGPAWFPEEIGTRVMVGERNLFVASR